ncbi:MerR family transcriptional regulator [Nocardioides sp. C4-1]|uniref:MerR family transcriptional regulator n=1 Tax=Nocardioides sp. C4-1 TaxID=3151851 RepID=UPI00326576C3
MSETFTIQQASRLTGLSVPTLRYYERVGLIDAVPRDRTSGHRVYDDDTVQTAEALACLRATGMGIDDMRTYRSAMAEGRAAAPRQRELFESHVSRVADEIASLQVRLEYLQQKVALWGAREHGDPDAEQRATERLRALAARL